MTYFVYESWWGNEYNHYAKVHFAHCRHCNNGRGRKDIQEIADVLSRWLGPFHDFHEAKDAAVQTGKPIKFCGICAPH